MDEKDLYFLKLDKNLIISDNKGKINKYFSIDFKTTLDNNIDIDLYEILELISEKSYQSKDGKYSISINKERYTIKLKEVNDIIYLDDLLIKFFEKMYHKWEKHSNQKIKVILIYNRISYELRLIIQQTALINGIDIIHTIDTNKSLMFFIKSLKKVAFYGVDSNKVVESYIKPLVKNSSSTIENYISIIIIYNKNIDIAIYNYNPIRKLFNKLEKKPSFLELIKLNFKNGYILLDYFKEEKIFTNFKAFIMNIVEKEMGKQIFQDIERIYVFDADNINLNQFIFLGASNALKAPITQQCLAVFKIIDKDNSKINKFNEMRINKNKYNITKKRIPILLDLELPYEGCFYLTVKLSLLNEKDNDMINITVYLNQINYYYISLSPIHINSIELIFYKTFPNKLFKSKIYEDITYEENFENNEHFKRMCLINIDREELNFIENKDKYGEIFDTYLYPHYKNLTVVFGEDLKIFSFYKKDISSIIISPKYTLYDVLKIFENLNSNTSFPTIQIIKNELNNNYFNINKVKFRFKQNFSNIINKNISLLISYGKFNIFEGCFVQKKQNLTTFNYDKDSFIIFINMMKQIELFHKKCNDFIKDDLTIGKLYLTACYALKDYLESGEKEDLNTEIIDIINFKDKETIYYSGYENNLEFILKLNKESFLYPILLQFNSGFKSFKYDENEIPSCMVSKITLQQIKLDLIRSLDNYGIKISFDTGYLANSCLNTGITIYNEKKIFGKKLDKNEILTKFDINYHKRTSISFIQRHEIFSHLKKTFNKNELNYLYSPNGYIDYKNNRILDSKKENNEENGETLEFFLTGGNIKLIDNLFKYRGTSFDFKNLFKVNLLLERTNENLIKILSSIPEIKENNNKQEGLTQYKNVKKDNSNNKYKTINSIKIQSNSKDSNNDENEESDESDEYTKEKTKLLNQDIYRKYTFPKNTIYCEILDYETGQIVPEKKKK